MFDHLKGRKLYRSPKDALVFGIAAGLAQYPQVDAVFVRLIMAALVYFAWWPTLLLYIAGVVLMPIDPAQDTVQAHQEPKDVTPPSDSRKPSESEHMDGSQNM